MEMSQKIMDATEPLEINVVTKDATENPVPMYRVRGNERRFMAWVERSAQLRGALEILSEGDEVRIVRRESNA
jgi:uncharacterized membrane protein YidH (DUF202 family)